MYFLAPRNFDPSLHPFQEAREYVRALNAVKLERVFAKPFVGNLDGHTDSLSCLCKHPQQLTTLLSGAYNGEVRIWDIPQRTCTRDIIAHDGIVRGNCYFLIISTKNSSDLYPYLKVKYPLFYNVHYKIYWFSFINIKNNVIQFNT